MPIDRRLALRRHRGEGAIDALTSIYDHAQARLEVLVQEALDRQTEFTAAYYARQLAAVRRELGLLAEQRSALIAPAVVTTYRVAMEAVDASGAGLRPVGAAVDSLRGGAVNRHAITVLANNLNSNLVGAETLVGRRVDDVFRRVGLLHTAVGRAAGEGVPQIAAGIESDLLHEGVTAFVARNGARWRLGPYARMVARTTGREANTAGVSNRLAERGSYLVTVSDHGDTDEACADHAGQTYDLRENPDLPPYHPNCIHVTTPAEGNLDAFIASLLD